MVSNVTSTYTDDQSKDQWQHNSNYENAIRILITAVGFTGIVNNSLVFVVACRVRNLRSLSNFYVVSQAAIDFVCASVVFFLHLVPIPTVPPGAAGELLCRLWQSRFLMWASFNASTYNLVALTLERYFAVVYPLKYVAVFTFKKAAVILVIAWAMAYAFTSYTIALIELRGDHCARTSLGTASHMILGAAAFVFQYLIPMCVMMFAYIHIGINLKASVSLPMPPKPFSTTAGQTGQTSQAREQDPSLLKARRNVYKTFCLVFAAFVVCFTPNQVLFLLYNLNAGLKFNERLTNFTIICVYCNCAVNPVIYALKYKQFRAGLKKTFCCKNEVAAESTAVSYP